MRLRNAQKMRRECVGEATCDSFEIQLCEVLMRKSFRTGENIDYHAQLQGTQQLYTLLPVYFIVLP